jgi:pimeloyl-ACP methyl ester carboxylesterase
MSEVPDDTPSTPHLLARFGGQRPPAAAWFHEALAVTPDRTSFELDGAAIELLTWGKLGDPGLLFLHGGGAHADWWSFIAPFFSDRFRCAALSWSGMGGSGWRDRYSIPLYGLEALRAIDVAKLDVVGPPTVIAHSFGGQTLLHLAADHGSRIRGGILVDSLVPRRRAPRSIRSTPLRRYASHAEALARFRFVPPQSSDSLEIVDHIARGSIRELPASDTAATEWSWRADHAFGDKIEPFNPDELVERIEVPIALIYGEQSAVVSAQGVAQMEARLPRCVASAAVPHAQHHVMVDQPIALVAALRVAISAISHAGEPFRSDS